MRAALRCILSIENHDLSTWHPSGADFAVGIRLLVGPDDGEGEESFDLTVCSPSWLAERADEEAVYDARHHLVVVAFDFQLLENYLKRRVEACRGTSWDEVAQQVARLGYWEFEDYRE